MLSREFGIETNCIVVNPGLHAGVPQLTEPRVTRIVGVDLQKRRLGW